MPDYIITVREINAGAFTDSPGATTFLKLDDADTAPFNPVRAIPAHDWVIDLIGQVVKSKDATGVASTRDLGSGGLFLNTQAELPQGGVLLLRIPFGQSQIVVNAQVVYCNPGRGVGLQFQGLSQENKALLEAGLVAE